MMSYVAVYVYLFKDGLLNILLLNNNNYDFSAVINIVKVKVWLGLGTDISWSC